MELPGAIGLVGDGRPDPKGDWWSAYLVGERPAPVAEPASDRPLRAVDLFCGTGGLALGVAQLAAELGVRMVTEMVADSDAEAVAVYAANHDTRLRCIKSVSSLLDYRVRGRSADAGFVYPPEIVDPGLAEAVGGVDVVMAGPPCQGHSNLNNRTRRSDRRNTYYLTVPAFAVAASARMAIIENVPEVEHDDRQVVEVAQRLFEAAGYGVVRGTLRADAMGWPQTRRRSFLVARRDAAPIPLDVVAEALADAGPRTLEWAIGDLTDREDCGIMDVASEMSPENRERVDWLFDNGEYDLPNAWRPECHRDGTTYGSVYGRMWPDKPAPTITTGFMTPGRGRYVHPTRRRTLTPREAARIQGFPDTYRFVADPRHPPSRAKLAKWIGDAVPMPLGYGAALSALGPGLDATGGSGSSGGTDSDTHLDN
ncbi:MAG: DNA cytosine methyltransferase [bacterium]|nr:DNA cytosine methyltransferase [bacterium]